MHDRGQPTRAGRGARTRSGAALLVATLVAALLPVLVASAAAPAAAAEPTNGMLAYSAEPPCPQGGCDVRYQRIWAQTPEGSERVWLTETSANADAQEWAPRWSPDGNTAVFYRGYGYFELGQVKADGTGGKAFGYNGHSAQSPDWSPDGQWVYYHASGVMWRVRPDGTGSEKVPWPSTMYYAGGPFAFAPDGRLVFYGSIHDDTGYHSSGIYVMDLSDGTGATATLLVSEDQLPALYNTTRFDISATGVLLFDHYDNATTLSGCIESTRIPYVLYTVPVSGGTPTRLSPPSTFSGPDYLGAGWSPDGTQIVASSQTYECTDRGVMDYAESDTVILTADAGFVRSLGVYVFYGADWQPCTAETITCTPPDSVDPTPSPTPSESVDPTPSPTPSESVDPTPSPTPSESVDPTPSPTPTSGPAVEPPPVRSGGVTRLAGTDRYSTGAAVSRGSFPGTANDIFVVTGANWPDALSAGPAAARVNGPVLPVQTSAVPAAISAEIDRLQPLRAWVIGGPSAISDSVVSDLQGRGLEVTRVSGTDRYSTAAAVADRFFPDAAGAYYASGAGYADALGGGAAAARRDWPLLLTAKDSVPAATPLLGDERIVLGGPAAISESVRTQLGARRVAGTDRYGTAAATALDAFSSADVVYLATGLNFPDALAGTPAAARDDAPLLLAAKGCVTIATRDAVEELGATSRVVLGGPAVVTDAAANLTLC